MSDVYSIHQLQAWLTPRLQYIEKEGYVEFKTAKMFSQTFLYLTKNITPPPLPI